MSGTRRPVSASARTAVTSFVHIDLPIFIGSDVACGYFGCDVEVERLPQKDESFPWPKPWLIAFRELFERQSTQVWGKAAWDWPPSEIHFTLYGLVCADWDEARALVQHIERVSGSLFNGHDRWWSAECGISEREQVPRLDKPIEGDDAAIFEVSVNGRAVGIESVEHLGCWLHELDVQKEFELWTTAAASRRFKATRPSWLSRQSSDSPWPPPRSPHPFPTTQRVVLSSTGQTTYTTGGRTLRPPASVLAPPAWRGECPAHRWCRHTTS
ncbi:hypothetical protein SAMN02787076_04350 [Rhizobacter sp. OV335]|nr:hypothetical protein SAMN02787076_04350 [Rhizobacter sp. OV335]